MQKRITRLAFLSTLAGIAYPTLPRNALAGDCAPAGGPDIVCSGPLNAATDTTQTLIGANLIINTEPGFGIDTSVSGGDAIIINGSAGGLTFSDQNQSTITGAVNGLNVTQSGAGDVAIRSNGTIRGIQTDGILAQNNGDGALIIEAATVSGGAAGDGIEATNGSATTAAGTDIIITTSGAIEAGQMALIARNYGSGEIIITTSGPVTVTGGTTGDQWAGIFARNGDLESDGTVIRAGTDITITASGDVRGFYNGIASYSFGSGSNVVHTTGDVEGRAQAGILARNGIFEPPGGGAPVQAGTFVSVTAEGNVTGEFQGVRVDNVGTEHIFIATSGDVTGRLVDGIQAHNSTHGTYLTILANTVTGGTVGINAINEGSGPLTVTITGTVQGLTDEGILLDTVTSNALLTVSGLVRGSTVSGTAAAVDATGVAGTVRLELQPGYGFTGIVDARNAVAPSGNRLVFGGAAGEASFDLAAIAGTAPDGGDVLFGFDDVFAKEDGSTFIFTGTNSPGAEFTAATVTGSGLALLAPDARLTMATGATPFMVQSGGVGAIGDGGVLDGDLAVAAAGAVVLSNAGPFAPVAGLGGAGDIMRVTGNHHSDGGGFYLDAFLDDGTAELSDMLIVAGDTSGTTFVFVDNAGGPGGITGRGATDGIKIVDVGGTSDGLFALAAPAYGGAFAYGLFQADGEDWYLQTTHLRDQAILAPYVPYSLRAFGSKVTGDYLERTGTRMGWQTGDGGAAESSSLYAGWARLLGAWSDADGSLLGGFNDVSYSESLWAVQAGFDVVIAGNLVASAFLHYGGIDSRADNETTGSSAGAVDTNGFGGGASLTYATDSGLYLDGVATYTRYDIDMNGEDADGSTHANGWTVSAEAGRAFAVSNALTLTPQAQLTYQAIDVDRFTDNSGLDVDISDADSLLGRLGLRVEHRQDFAAGSARLHADASLLEEFLDDPVATVGATPLALGFDDSGYQLELGVTFNRADSRIAVWLNGNYQAPFNADEGIATWNATGGVAVRF